MGKKGKKTRWRRLPIGGTDEEGGLSLETAPPTTDHRRITFNEDEYTKITTPRQDVLFKKGYLGRKRTTPSTPAPTDSQDVHSGDSVEGESYVGDEVQFGYSAGYVDPSGMYYVNGNTYETYDPYTGTVTVVVGPAPQYPGGPPVMAALPCQPVPLQPVEWFAPPTPWCYSYNKRKRYSTDSQNYSAQSSESTGPPGSPQETEEGACAIYPPQYVYPGYMFGPPIYNMNGVTMQGVVPQPMPQSPDSAAGKRRKKRRRRRRGGVTDDGSDSSCCEEPCQLEASSNAICQSGASSTGSVSSKANSDSGINTDPTPNSGSNTPPLPLHITPTIAQVTESVSNIQLEYHEQFVKPLSAPANEELVLDGHFVPQDLPTSFTEEIISGGVRNLEPTEEIVEALSPPEDDVTPNLCVSAPEFSSQESTLSCLYTPSATKDLLPNEQEFINIVVEMSQEEMCQSCHSVAEASSEVKQLYDEALPNDRLGCESVFLLTNVNSTSGIDNNSLIVEKETKLDLAIEHVEEHLEELNNEPLEKNVNCGEIPGVYLSTAEEELCIAHDEYCQPNLEIIRLEENVQEIDSTQTIPFSIETPPSIKPIEPVVENSSYVETLAPVPPPRRKRSMCRAAERLASTIVEEAMRDALEEAARVRLKSPLSITEAVTRWLNSQGSSPLTCPVSDSECEEDEGIEVGEELTGQKNVRGNPFLVPYHSGTGQRVAKDCNSVESSVGEWDYSHTRDMCDPSLSVDKYYRLAVVDGPADKVSPSVYKTALHIRHTGPFPCGVCCIIQ